MLHPTGVWDKRQSLQYIVVPIVFLLSRVSFATPRTVASQAPLFMEFPWDFLGKDSGVGCHFLFQEIFLTLGLNLCLLHWQAIPR